jgi:hypothetical protein
MSSELYHAMITLREQAKLLHFQTRSFAVHKATDWFIGEFDGAFDTYWETAQGNGARIKDISPMILEDLSGLTARSGRDDHSVIEPCLSRVEKMLQITRKAPAARDEILDLIEQFRYLLSFQ